MAIPKIPSVIVNGRKAMTELVEHLVTVHARKRLAFIGGLPGNSEAEARLAAYLDVLERHNLARFPEFLVHGYFARDRGERAMHELLSRNIEFDAVVCANDTMAFGAYDALRRANILVPRQVSVTGFDDVLASKVCSPRLTTVTQPFPELVQTALRLVVLQLLGEIVPELTELNAQVTLRASCGCNVPEHTNTHEAPVPILHKPVLTLDDKTQRAQLTTVAIAALEDGFRSPKEIVNRLIPALQDDLQCNDRRFVTAIEHIIQEAPGDGMRFVALQRMISRLRQALLPISSIELENLWHEARDILSVAASAGHIQHTLELHAVTLDLQSSSDRLADALDLSTLTRSVATSIHVLGFSSARVTRYIDSDLQNGSSLLNVCNGHSVAPPATSLSGDELFAPSYDSNPSTYAGVVFPLVFEGQCHGIIAFTYSPQVRGYQLLRDQLAAALRNVTKHQHLLERTREHERSVQERAATAQRLEALSVLAGSIAHDLNNALGPVGLLLEMIVSELKQIPVEQYPCLNSVFDDAETIQHSVRQSAQIVMDLLTLGRQGRIVKLTLDVTALIKRVSESESVLLSHRDGPRISLLTDYCSAPVYVRGAEVQLTRVVINLLRNAMDASDCGGAITLSTQRRQLTNPLHAYETILPGDYAVITVTDQGCGIEKSQLSRIFEPYFSNKRTTALSGTGLGLAIVHAVVKDHDGFVDVESTIGVGTAFRVYLPVVTYP
jgi:signal transduction histidine kinase